jgi:hypothetical protein
VRGSIPVGPALAEILDATLDLTTGTDPKDPFGHLAPSD